MKTLFLFLSMVTAHADLPANSDKPWLDRAGNRTRGADSAREDREWMQDGGVRRAKQAREDREWMKDGGIRRSKQAREDREWMKDGGIRRSKQAREDRDWNNDGPTKRRPYTQTAENEDAPESVR